VRLPVTLRLASGELRDVELTHPTPVSEWTGAEVREVVQALLRLLGVRKDQLYGMLAVWGNLGFAVQVRSADGIATMLPQAVFLAAIGQFTGNEEVPPQGRWPLVARLEAAAPEQLITDAKPDAS
jgi:hypothetical protein